MGKVQFEINGTRMTIGDIEIPPEFFVLCFSHSQQAFHRESLVDHIKTNLSGFRDKKPMDYLILGIFPDDASCMAWYGMMCKILDRPDISNLTYDDLIPPDF
ncbi:hypothetical protein [Flavitalea sp.]|nr:hypothetical protein [Flavitalea sp.]